MALSHSSQLSLFETAAPALSPPRAGDKTKPAQAKQPSYITGHRKRLRERFLVGGADPLPDYELLELLLFRSLKNGDVKPVAHRLIRTFGDFNRVISAPIDRLKEVDGIGRETALDLKLIEAATHRLSQGRVLKRPVISSWSALLDYCRVTMAHRETEQFRILFLDRKNVLIADETQGRGTVDHVPVYPREVIKRALDLNASALILVHNHPSGDPTPSTADITMTEEIARACGAVGITVHDHLIVGKSTETSFKSEGYL
jgi:DNA repair protein RadC